MVSFGLNILQEKFNPIFFVDFWLRFGSPLPDE